MSQHIAELSFYLLLEKCPLYVEVPNLEVDMISCSRSACSVLLLINYLNLLFCKFLYSSDYVINLYKIRLLGIRGKIISLSSR